MCESDLGARGNEGEEATSHPMNSRFQGVGGGSGEGVRGLEKWKENQMHEVSQRPKERLSFGKLELGTLRAET